MNTTQKIAYNTVAQIVGKAATTITTLLVTILVTRRFGPAGYGDFTIMLAYGALFYIVSDFGLNAIVTRDLSADETKTALYFRNLLAMRLVIGFFLFGIGILILTLFPYSKFVKTGVIISLLTIFTQALHSSANAIFQTRLRYDFSVLASILGSLVILILAFLLVLGGRSLLPVVGSYVVGGIVVVAASLIFVGRVTGAFRPATFANVAGWFDLDLWRYLFISALPLGIATVFTVVLQRADALMLSVFESSEVVGYYGASYKIFEFALVFPTFFINSVYPIMVRHFKDGQDRLLRTVKLSGLFLLAVSILGSIIGFVLSPLIIRIVAGPEFGDSVLTLRLLLLGLPFFYLSALFLWLLITLGKQKQIPVVYGVGALSNVVLNLVLIPRYSLYAPAVTTWVSEALILGLLVFFSFRALRN